MSVPKNDTTEMEELYSIYAWWAAVLILRMMTLTWFTGRLRVENKIIHSEEDRMFVGADVIPFTSGGGHPDVDRIRDAHRDDVAVVVPFLLIVPTWLSASPSPILAGIILRCFAITRLFRAVPFVGSTGIGSRCGVISLWVSYAILGYIGMACMTGHCH